MRYLALACDYDGTLAHDGKVSKSTVEALKRYRASGRRLIMVTGRELEDLMLVFPELNMFERIVAEKRDVRSNSCWTPTDEALFQRILVVQKNYVRSVAVACVAARNPGAAMVRYPTRSLTRD